MALLTIRAECAIAPSNLYLRANTYGALNGLRPYTEWNSSTNTHDLGIEPIYDYSWKSISRLAMQTASELSKNVKNGVVGLFARKNVTADPRMALADKEGSAPDWDGWTGEATLTEEQRSFIDGEIVVKMGNVSGYDLYFPNGSYMWTKDILGEYLCQNTYSGKPWKDSSDEFDLVGFVFALFLGLLISAAITAAFPTLILIKTQNENLAAQAEENAIALDNIASAVNAQRVEKDEDEEARRKEKLKRMDILSIVWMAVGSIVCVALAVFIADMILAAYGARHILHINYVGECYTFNVDNIRYKEPDDADKLDAMRTIATIRANKIIAKNLRQLRRAKAARYANDSAMLLSSNDELTHETVKKIRSNLLSSSSRNMRSAIGLTYANGSRITLADFDGEVERKVLLSATRPLDDKNYETDVPKYLSTASVTIKTNDHVIITCGCDSAFYSPSTAIEWRIKPEAQPACADVTMRWNQKQENIIKLGCPSGKGKQKIDKPEWASHEFGYSCTKKGCTCCKPCAACNQWVCNNIFWNVTNETWKECIMRNGPIVLTRNEEDITKKYKNKFAHKKISDSRIYWQNGWLQKDAEMIVKHATFSDGLGSSIYVGDDDDAMWLKSFVTGNNPTSYSLIKPLEPETAKYLPTCVEEFTITLDDSTADLVEFANWCDNVKAEVDNSTGIVYFSTESVASCAIEVGMSADAGSKTNTLRISKLYPQSAFGVTMWKCRTSPSDGSRGFSCDYDQPMTAFIATEFRDTFKTKTINDNYADSNSPGDAGVNLKLGLSMGGGLSNLKTVAVFFAYIIAGVALIVLIVFIAKASKKCKSDGGKSEKSSHSRHSRRSHHRRYSRSDSDSYS